MTDRETTQRFVDTGRNDDESTQPDASQRTTLIEHQSQDAKSAVAGSRAPSSNDVIGATVAPSAADADSSRPAEVLKQRQEAVHLKRGISRASTNFQIINQVRQLALKEIPVPSDDGDQQLQQHQQHQKQQTFVDNSTTTFALPDLTRYPEGLKAFLYKELIEMSTLVSLEQGGHLNWWADIGVGPRLYPMVTCGDGNCLLHAASLAMWGFHDRQLTLRKLLSDSMTSSSVKDAYKRRWRWQQTLIHKQCGLMFTEDEWNREWQLVVKLAGPTPKIDGTNSRPATTAPRSCAAGQSSDQSEVTFESLEEIHVFILAHVLRRPIVVVSKTMLIGSLGEALALIPFGGIYLPLELPPGECHRTPILLTYDAAHFCALVSMNDDQTTTKELTIPLVGHDLEPLPVHFAVDPGSDFNWSRLDDPQFSLETSPLSPSSFDRSAGPIHLDRADLLDRYMDVRQVTLCSQKQPDDAVSSTSSSTGADPKAKPRPGSWSGRRQERIIPRVSSSSSGFDNVVNSADGGVDPPGGTLGKNSLNDPKRTTAGGGSLPRGLPGVLKTVGSLGQNFSRTLRKLAAAGGGQGGKSKKRSVGTATQSSQATSTAQERLIPGSEVTCAAIVRNRMIFEDQLVRNYLDSAARRFEELQELRQLQCQELQDRLSSPLTSSSAAASADPSVGTSTLKSTTSTTTQYSPSLFNRQNTLLLTGRSKFYTLSHEQQCADRPVAGVTASDNAASGPSSSSSTRRLGHRVDVDHQNGASKSGSTVSSTSSSPASNAKPLAVGVGASKKIGSVKKSNLSGALDNNNNNNASSKGSDDGVDDLSSRDNEERVICMHAGRPNKEYLCTQCSNANDFAHNFSRTVGYPTSHTKL